ncbi:unnamed protein product, partial [Polarella glacialis]
DLAPFGEIMRLELLPAQLGTVVVSYYDIRAAVSAARALGPDRCTPEPQHGHRSVLIHGEVELPSGIRDQVSGIKRGGDGKTYTLEFFDTRVAAQIHKENGAATKLPTNKEKASAFVAPCRTHVAKGDAPAAPRYRNSLRLAEVNWADLASGSERRTTLRLQFLPLQLCDVKVFDNVLKTNGLSQHVDVLRVFPGSGRAPGSALVNATSSSGVTALAKFFHGRQWGSSMKVSVSFAVTQGFDEVQRKFPLQAAIIPQTALVPRRVDLFSTNSWSDAIGQGTSEVSTEADEGSESPHCDQVFSEAMPVLFGCAFSMPNARLEQPFFAPGTWYALPPGLI